MTLDAFGKALSRLDVFVFGNSPLYIALCVGQKEGTMSDQSRLSRDVLFPAQPGSGVIAVSGIIRFRTIENQ